MTRLRIAAILLAAWLIVALAVVTYAKGWW